MGHMGTQKKRIWLTVSTQKTKIRYDHRVSRKKQKTKKAVGLVWVFLPFSVFCLFLDTQRLYLILVFCVETVSQIRFFWVPTWPTYSRKKNSPLLVACPEKYELWDKIAKNWDLMVRKGHSFGHVGPKICQNQLRNLWQHSKNIFVPQLWFHISYI